MTNFLNNLPHLLIALAVIGAASTLMALGVLTAGEGLGLIGAAGGFSLGVSAGSTSISTVASALPAVSTSSGGSTSTITPQLSHVSATTPPPATS